MPPVLSYGTCTDTGRLADLSGAVSAALGGVPIPDLPVAAVAPEYMEQKATIDAVFALAFGLYTYVNPVPTVTGAPNLVKLLTEDCPRSRAVCSAWRPTSSRPSMACWRTSRRNGRSWVSDLVPHVQV